MVKGTPIQFGKHKGEAWESLVNTNPAYILWAGRTLKKSNCPKVVLRAAIKVINKRMQVDPFTGSRPYWNWDHPDYIKYYK